MNRSDDGRVKARIRENNTILHFPTGDNIAAMTLEATPNSEIVRKQSRFLGIEHKYRTRSEWIKVGGGKIYFIKGFQLRYIYFIDKRCRQHLTVPEIPFSKIDEMGAGMYKGENVTRAERHAIKTERNHGKEFRKTDEIHDGDH